ncbi:MAG: SurA N-terminal domain-containing protein [Polaribacter sp.]|nr:SurA N-terminal domain-containing protein [Polaribacter sp.]
MAILSKIRDRSLALILVIGLALFAFVLDPSSIEEFLSSSKVNTVGEVDGETISRKEFSEALEVYKSQVGNRTTEMEASNIVWDNLVRQKIYQAQLAESGITVGESDVWNALIETPSIKNNPQYQNEIGLFDQEKLKEFLKIIKEDVNQKATWAAWTNYMSQIKKNLENTTYNNLITAGLGASLKEGENQYFNTTAKVTSQYVYVPYTTIADSIVKVTKSEIDSYVKAHASNYKVEASRDLNIVKFDILPTAEDETAIKNEVAELLNDKGAFKGLKNTEDLEEFFEDSDIPLEENYNFKNSVSVEIAEAVFNGKAGAVFGPYKDRGYFKISKLLKVTQMPDSVKSAHILIPFIGSVSADQETTKTEAQAKKTADSILSLVRRNKKKFAAIADAVNPDGTKGKGGDIGWVTKNVAYSPNFDADFANYLFFNKKRTTRVVKTKFGYHIIRIDNLKNKQKAVKLATFARQLDASVATENKIFQEAETLALELSNGKSFDELVKEKNLTSRPAIGLKVLDENVPGVGNQREIITWAFNSEQEVGDFKRFDTEKGHVVVVITNQTKKGLMSAKKAQFSVRPILINQKKAAIISEKMNGTTLDAIAKANNTTLRNASGLTLSAPMISGVGYEPTVVGAMSTAKENTLFSEVEGEKGVFAFVVTKKEQPVTLPSYDSYRKRIADQRKKQTKNIYEAIKEAANVKDGRSTFYGIN